MNLFWWRRPKPHKHAWRMHDEVTGPVGLPPGHTKFFLMVCDSCRSVQAWPQTNWNLINKDWRDEAIRRWKDEDVTFLDEEIK